MVWSRTLHLWLLIAAAVLPLLTEPLRAVANGAVAPSTDSEDAPVELGRTPEADELRLRAEIGELLGQLDSNDYATRRRAAERLEVLVDMPEHGALLAAEFRRVLRQPDVSFEVHWHLDRWKRRLPELLPEPPGNATPEELDQVVRQLDADAYAVRLAAVRRLEWLLGNGRLVGPVASRIEARFQARDLSEPGAEYLDDVWGALRPVWSQSDPAEWDLPHVTDEAIARLVDDLARAAPAGTDSRQWPPVRTAERELRDLLMRDEYVRRVAAALKARLEKPADPDAHVRLQTLFEETQPAMVAEYWQNRQHLVEQHLLIGVPSQTVGAPRPSHFDRIDDRTAHCVCGSSLSPGEYPVGIAIPHPRTNDAVFHLVNLPTPRRRLWYRRHAATDPAVRLEEISRRTVDWLREQGRPVDEDDLRTLAGLDPAEVSRFAGWYFTAIADSPLPEWTPRPDPYAPGQFIPLSPSAYLGGRPSRHGALCLLLAADGTRDAVPGLLAAIEQNRFLPPSEPSPYRLDWIAALSIAHRDPWSEIDQWLARAVASGQKLKLFDESGAEVGATAAAVLLARHGQRFADFGLQPVGDDTLTAMGLSGYRFVNPACRQRVQTTSELHFIGPPRCQIEDKP